VELVKKYVVLTKPGIIRGNVMTAGAGFLFAARGSIDTALLLATLGGTSLVIGSACVLNNMLDRRIDAKMARTKKRALVTGDISLQSAGLFATLLAVIGFWLLIGFTNWLTVGIGVVAVLFYVAIYGYYKRRSEHGTLVGTVPGAASLVAGYTAVSGRVDSAAVMLFLIMVCWQMPHFYAIAIRRKREYAAAGLPVLPVRRNVRTAKRQIVAYIAAYICASAALSVFGPASVTYLVVMMSLGFMWLWRAVQGFDGVDDTLWAGRLFGFSLLVLTVFSALLAVDTWLP
jgi:heme o synthase